MIFDRIVTAENETVLKPTWNSSIDAPDLNKMLEDCFPYNNYTFDRGLWNFHLCCWNGYDNAVIFRD